MEKILRRLFIVSILISVLTIPKVHAEERYITASDFATSQNFSTINFGYSSTLPDNSNNYNFKSYSFNNNNYNFGVYDKITYLTIFKKDNLYLIINYRLSDVDSDSLVISSGGITVRKGNTNINGLYQNYFTYVLDYNEDNLSYINTHYYLISSSTNSTYVGLCSNCNFTSYLYASHVRNNTSYTRNFYANLSEFTLVYSDLKVYNGDSSGNLTEIEVQPESQPEPEQPTIPPYNFNNNKYYVPNYHEGQCVEVLDKDTIRVFEDNFTDFYTDYYINSNYISKQGQVDLSYEKNCSTLEFTDIRYYGNDFPQILIITLVIITFTIGFPYILYKRFRKR